MLVLSETEIKARVIGTMSTSVPVVQYGLMIDAVHTRYELKMSLNKPKSYT